MKRNRLQVKIQKEKAKAYALKRIYGISLEEYNELLERQGNSCAVCKRDQSVFGKNLSVDHDHVTGEIRGLLCQHCNHRVVGRHRTPDLLQAAATYLQGPFTGLIVPKKVRKRKRNARLSSR